MKPTMALVAMIVSACGGSAESVTHPITQTPVGFDSCAVARPDFGGPATQAELSLFAYDAKAPLNLQKTVENTSGGVEFSGISYDSPAGGRVTGILVNPALGGTGVMDYAAGKIGEYDFAGQMISQLWGVGTTILWSGIGSLIVFGLIKLVIGLRVKEEVEREGLDIGEHGERAYNM